MERDNKYDNWRNALYSIKVAALVTNSPVDENIKVESIRKSDIARQLAIDSGVPENSLDEFTKQMGGRK
ncbi:hypothetical protein GOV13_01445 [Candidatus Pacearchaeota archaeon]|nr:hypothetical protein [Candidatus Pacearchaeota archaeon]